MKVLIYGHRANKNNLASIQLLFQELTNRDIEASIFKGYSRQLTALLGEEIEKYDTWSDHEDVKRSGANFVITLGGDGTILGAVTHIRDSGIPIVGINLGRLGFLASIEETRIEQAIEQMMDRRYSVEERSLLYLESNPELFGDCRFALNDFTLHKRDTSSMIIIHTFVNGDFLNSYWADGLIVATPTGSTGYSLSCGGPIIFPNSGNLVLTPVAPHNLNVRPIVLSDESVISFEIEGRSANFLCTLDSRFETITANHQLAVRKSDFNIKLVHLDNVTFLKTIHEKLSWGIDQRN